MSALNTRATVAAEGDFYLSPLAHLKDEPGLLEDLLVPWVDWEDETERVFLPEDLLEAGLVSDPELALAWGFQVSRPLQAKVAGRSVKWEEQLSVVRSRQYMQSTQKLLHRRLDRAESLDSISGTGQTPDRRRSQSACSHSAHRRKVSGAGLV
jgi:hypothetical protein